jgi:hypothetical protein
VELIGERPFEQDENYRKFVEVSKTFGLTQDEMDARKVRKSGTNPLGHYHNPSGFAF